MGSLKRYARQAVETLRYDGVGILLWKLFTTGLYPVCRVGIEYVFAMDLTQQLTPQFARIPFEIREASTADVDALVDAEYGPPAPDDVDMNDEEEFQEALRETVRANVRFQYLQDLQLGEKCYVAWADGKVAHINWTRFARAFPIVNCPLWLRAGKEVFTSDAYTPPEFRGQGVHGEVNMHMLLEAQRAGNRIAYTMTDLIRTGSRRGLVRIGWQQHGKLLYVAPRMLGRTFIFRINGMLGPIERAR